mmetsp:Transcript_87231/g.227740  ORF Transcript_87231/g.227740 Transcript_87231/m.227740 type:complete len:251 (-) Transcript_87231:335-1087(-)
MQTHGLRQPHASRLAIQIHMQHSPKKFRRLGSTTQLAVSGVSRLLCGRRALNRCPESHSVWRREVGPQSPWLADPSDLRAGEQGRQRSTQGVIEACRRAEAQSEQDEVSLDPVHVQGRRFAQRLDLKLDLRSKLRRRLQFRRRDPRDAHHAHDAPGNRGGQLVVKGALNCCTGRGLRGSGCAEACHDKGSPHTASLDGRRGRGPESSKLVLLENIERRCAALRFFVHLLVLKHRNIVQGFQPACVATLGR